MYDLWLSTGCTEVPDLLGLAKDIPVLADTYFLSQLREASPKFLGLEIPETYAITLLQCLRRARARGIVIQSVYREPKVVLAEAAHIAEHTLRNQILHHYPTLTFGPITFQREHAMWWTFFTACREWIDQDFILGGLFAVIDKIDGHNWSDEAMEHFFERQELFMFNKI